MPVKAWQNDKYTATRKQTVEEGASKAIVKLGGAHQIPEITTKVIRANQDQQARTYSRQEQTEDQAQQNDESQTTEIATTKEKDQIRLNNLTNYELLLESNKKIDDIYFGPWKMPKQARSGTDDAIAAITQQLLHPLSC